MDFDYVKQYVFFFQAFCSQKNAFVAEPDTWDKINFLKSTVKQFSLSSEQMKNNGEFVVLRLIINAVKDNITTQVFMMKKKSAEYFEVNV